MLFIHVIVLDRFMELYNGIVGSLMPQYFDHEIDSKKLCFAAFFGLSTFVLALTITCAVKNFLSQLSKLSTLLLRNLQILRSGSRISFGLLITSIAILVAAPFLILAVVIRSLILIFSPSDLERPYGTDILWSSKTMEADSKILGALTFEGKVDIKKIRKRFEEVITTSKDASGQLLYRRMMQNFVLFRGYYVWKPVDDFKIEDHVREMDIETLYGRENITLKRDSDPICQYLDHFGDDPFVTGKPLWDITFINGKGDT